METWGRAAGGSRGKSSRDPVPAGQPALVTRAEIHLSDRRKQGQGSSGFSGREQEVKVLSKCEALVTGSKNGF